jgi:hypothetical protein
MSIGGINPGLIGGLRSLAGGWLLHGSIGAHASPVVVVDGGRPLEFWLTVVPAACVVSLGWLCLGLKAINGLCRDAAQPAIRAAWIRVEARGQRPRWRQRIAWWLWSAIKAGTWPDDMFNLGNWIAVSTVIGLTIGFVLYLWIG